MTLQGTLALGAAILSLAAGAALAQDGAEIHEKREAFMKQMAGKVGIMAEMAQGKTAYDAAKAQAAAQELSDLAGSDWTPLFVEGSDRASVPDSRALPEIWQNLDDVMAKHQALADATVTLAGAAGEGLDALKGALGGVGGACGACHKVYRAPE